MVNCKFVMVIWLKLLLIVIVFGVLEKIVNEGFWYGLLILLLVCVY